LEGKKAGEKLEDIEITKQDTFSTAQYTKPGSNPDLESGIWVHISYGITSIRINFRITVYMDQQSWMKGYRYKLGKKQG